MSKAPRVSQGDEALAAGQHLAAGDGHRALPPQLTEIVDGIGLQRLLEPADVVILQHLGGAHRPFEAVRPIGVAGPGIDEELRLRPRRLARRPHDGLVELVSSAGQRDPSRS